MSTVLEAKNINKFFEKPVRFQVLKNIILTTTLMTFCWLFSPDAREKPFLCSGTK